MESSSPRTSLSSWGRHSTSLLAGALQYEPDLVVAVHNGEGRIVDNGVVVMEVDPSVESGRHQVVMEHGSVDDPVLVMSKSMEPPREHVDLRSVLDVHVGVGGCWWVVLVRRGDVEAPGEVVLTVGALTRNDPHRHRGCHINLDACCVLAIDVFKELLECNTTSLIMRNG